jgi:hypothetical protein
MKKQQRAKLDLIRLEGICKMLIDKNLFSILPKDKRSDKINP